ncbi:tetratricopeptide repeat protein [Paraburkholderia sp. RL17-347-BIC-D]|uniref:tetratricopeptide repeat protein n=1 Tax=Paraburkholderia sp. RL17-347-BIC-D TaxID=3031632 RepID=UPI0038B85354
MKDEDFPQDRKEVLFGREADVERLLHRAQVPGLTAIVGRPLIGKTWTVTEVARRLLHNGNYLIGYHEAKGPESSHILYTVADLYTRWLADSTLGDQAQSLWYQYKDNLVPRMGQVFGMVFENVAGKQLSGGAAKLIRSAFDSLASAQKGLLSGGLQITPLPYDQACSLVDFVAKASARRVLLILDAWGKSDSVESESVLLEAYLKHLMDWSHCHVFLCIRHPDPDHVTGSAANARARNICRLSASAEVYELSSMDLSDPDEACRAIRFLRQTAPASTSLGERELIDLIDGYPGVIGFWTDPNTRRALQEPDDIIRAARDAQALRYADLEYALNDLPDEFSRRLAARLALFPRFDLHSWSAVRHILGMNLPQAAFDTLADRNVLSDGPFPTYGHDTRHSAARRWLIEHKRPLMRREASAMVETTAALIAADNKSDLSLIKPLSGFSEAADLIGVDPEVSCLIEAAKIVSGAEVLGAYSDFDALYPRAIQRNAAVVSLIAFALMKRALTKDENRDWDDSIRDLQTARRLPNAPIDVVALATYFLGIVLKTRGDDQKAVEEFSTAIALSNAPPDVLANAQLERGLIRHRSRDLNGAIDDFTSVVALTGDSYGRSAEALHARGIARSECGDSHGAIQDFSAVLAISAVSPDVKATALYLRGLEKRANGDYDGAIDDVNAAATVVGAPDDLVARAYFLSGEMKEKRDDTDGAINDYTSALSRATIDVHTTAAAFVYRAIARSGKGDEEGAISDYMSVIQLPNAPDKLLARSFFNIACIRKTRGKTHEAIETLTSVIQLAGAPVDLLADALIVRAEIRGDLGDSLGEIDDYTRVASLPGVSEDRLAMALSLRCDALEKARRRS